MTDNPAQTRDADRLTALDKLLEQAITASVAGSDGALNAEEIGNVIEEIIRINPQRSRSYYHKGFLDAILGNPAQPHFREENRDRRLWYLTGTVQAFEDRSDRKSVVDLFDRQELRDLGREETERSRLSAGVIFRCLCEENRVSAAVEFLAPTVIFHVGIFDWALEFGSKLLRNQDIKAAQMLFDLLDSSLRLLEPQQIASLGTSYFDLKRRQAHCLRYQRHFGDAAKILNELLEDPSAPERSAMAVDIALMGAGYRGLFDVVIPERDIDIDQSMAQLESILPQLEAAESLGGDTAHAAYCLGVLAVAKQRNPYRAADWLDKSVTNILRHNTAYDRGGLLSQARFYMGLARAETLNAGFAEKAGALFCEAIDAGFVPPEHLLKRYLEALSMINLDVAKRVAETAVKRLGASRVLDPILEGAERSESILSESILSSLLVSALDEKQSGKRRFKDLQRILKQAINGRHREIASDALDGMELIARNKVCTDEFLSLLEDEANYDPVWSRSDAAWSAIALYEREGKFAEARALLLKEFYRTLADKPYGVLEQAADILDEARRLDADEDELTTADRRLARDRAHVPKVPVAENLNGLRVLITVVGGDEQQARYDEAIAKDIVAQKGAVEIEFRHTGWSGGWGPEFDRMQSLLDRSDAVVVLRLIRTNLGRKVRDYAKRWIGCAGDSKSSIEGAVTLAVDLARKRGD